MADEIGINEEDFEKAPAGGASTPTLQDTLPKASNVEIGDSQNINYTQRKPATAFNQQVIEQNQRELQLLSEDEATAWESAKATFAADSTYSYAYSLFKNSMLDEQDPDYDPEDYILKSNKSFFEGLSTADKDFIIDNSKNQVHANSLALERLANQKNREIAAQSPWVSAGVMLFDGFATGGAIAATPRIVYGGAQAFKMSRLAASMSKVNQSRKARFGLGVAEGTVFGKLEKEGGLYDVDNSVLYAALGGPFEMFAGKMKMPEIVKKTRINKEGKTVSGYQTEGFDSGKGYAKAFSDEDVEDSMATSAQRTETHVDTDMKVADERAALDEVEAELTTKSEKLGGYGASYEPKIKDLKGQLRAARQKEKIASDNLQDFRNSKRMSQEDIDGAAANVPKSKRDKLDDFINEKEAEIASKNKVDVETVRSTKGFDDLVGISGRLRKAPRELDAARKLKAEQEYESALRAKEAERTRASRERQAIEQKIQDNIEQQKSIAKKKEAVDNDIEEVKVRKNEIENLDPDVSVPKSSYIIKGMKQQEEKLRSDFGDEFFDEYDFRVEGATEDLRGARDYAEANNDTSAVNRIDRELARREEDTQRLASQGKSIFNSVDTVFQDIGQRMRNYVPGVRNRGTGLVTSTQSTESGDVLESGADYYMDKYFNGFNGRMGEIVRGNYEDFLKEIKKDTFFNRFYAPSSSKKVQFDSDVVRLMHETSNNEPPIGRYPESVKKAAEQLKQLVADARKQAIDNGWEVSDEALEDLTTSALSRSPDNGAWINGVNMMGFEPISKMFEKAILKKNPAMNLRVTVRNLEERIENGADIPKKEIDDLRAEIRKVEEDELYAARHIEEQLALEESTYSRTLGKSYVANQYARATNNAQDIPTRSGGDGIWEAVEDLSDEALARLTDAERAQLEAVIRYRSKSSSVGGVDIFKRRLDMDTSMVVRATGKDGVDRSMAPVDFFDHNLENVLSRTLKVYSSASALAKKGYKNFEEFDKTLDDMRVEATKENSVSRTNAAQSDIEMIRKHFKVESQYDDTGAINQVKRIAKKFAAGAKLGYLMISMTVELANISARNGFGTTFSNLPVVMKSLKDMTTQRASTNGLNRAFYMSGLQDMQVFDNYLMNMDAGVFQSFGLKGKDFGEDITTTRSSRFLDKTERVASEFAHTFISMSRPMDIMLRRLSAMSVMDNLLNLSAKDLRAQRYLDAGVDEEFISKLEVARKYFTRKNGVITDFDYEGMKAADPNFADDFIVSTLRLSDRQVMTARFGQLPPLVNTQAFSWFGQFKSFALGTYNTQFKYDATVLDNETLLAWTAQTVAGIGAAYSREAMRSELEGRENKMEGLSFEQIIAIGLRESGPFALMTMMTDTVAEILTGKSFMNQYSTTQQNISPMIFNQIQDLVSAFPQLFSSIADPGTELGRKQIQDLLGLFVPHWMAAPASKLAQEAGDLPDATQSEEDAVLKMLEFDSLQ